MLPLSVMSGGAHFVVERLAAAEGQEEAAAVHQWHVQPLPQLDNLRQQRLRQHRQVLECVPPFACAHCAGTAHIAGVVLPLLPRRSTSRGGIFQAP